jgi:hypothetical protein
VIVYKISVLYNGEWKCENKIWQKQKVNLRSDGMKVSNKINKYLRNFLAWIIYELKWKREEKLQRACYTSIFCMSNE